MVIVDFLNGKLQGKYTSTIYPIVKAQTVRFFVNGFSRLSRCVENGDKSAIQENVIKKQTKP